MANSNTKRKRASGEDGYGQKRGYAIHSGFGAAHGSKKRRGPRVFKATTKPNKRGN